ncbi:unnamed protein product [Symbiodinium natans]|uniref:tRNA-uridine aminocarboxypropyltransferase 1 n=1 Tax=Symbiodinium natans TaxID=878477 RepID=A0A812UFX3_9DINO|nr:unnamed protein product [Symbiodinium natans]
MFYCPYCCTPLGVPEGVTVPRARLPFAHCDIIFDDAPKKATSIHAKVLAPEQVRLIDLFTTEANTNRTLSRPAGGTATKAESEDIRGEISSDANAVIREIPEYDPHITLVLFPDDSSATFEEVATESDVGPLDQLTLVVIDSPWKRAQVLRKHPRLAKLRSIRLGHPPPSRFWRYHSEGTGCVSTVEALAALAKEVLPRTGEAAEGPESPGFDSFMDDPFLFFFVRQFAYISENKRTAGAGEWPMDAAAKQRRMDQVRQKEAKRLKLRPFGSGTGSFCSVEARGALCDVQAAYKTTPDTPRNLFPVARPLLDAVRALAVYQLLLCSGKAAAPLGFENEDVSDLIGIGGQASRACYGACYGMPWF